VGDLVPAQRRFNRDDQVAIPRIRGIRLIVVPYQATHLNGLLPSLQVLQASFGGNQLTFQVHRFFSGYIGAIRTSKILLANGLHLVALVAPLSLGARV